MLLKLEVAISLCQTSVSDTKLPQPGNLRRFNITPGSLRMAGAYQKLSLAILFVLSITAVRAGTSVESKVIQQPSSPQPVEPWIITVGAPGWFPFVTGDIGLNGRTTHVNVGPMDIFQRTDFLAALRAEVSKGRFGVQGEFLYLNASDSVFPSRDLVSKLDLRIQETIGDFGLSYRILQGPRGWLDLRAGFRYTNLGQDLTIHPNNQAIDAVSMQAVDQVAQTLGGAINSIIQNTILDRLTSLQDRNPVLPVGPLAGRLPGNIRDLSGSEIQSRLGDLVTAIRSNIQARVNQIKTQLSDQIATTLKAQLNRSFARTDDWFDPYIGVGARYNLSNAFYLTTKADVGGFGIGADVTTEVSAGLGCQITRNIFSEVSFRYLYDDYDSGGLLYRVSTYGPELTLGLKF
jgi:hypothetical protein